jgi:hypothetical protein
MNYCLEAIKSRKLVVVRNPAEVCSEYVKIHAVEKKLDGE